MICYPFISVLVKVTGFHNWPSAPEEVWFLSTLHRHTFHIKVRVSVAHADRQVEFTILKKQVERFLAAAYGRIFDGYDFGSRSCEMLSKELAEHLETAYSHDVLAVSFSEDGEFEGGVQCLKER